MMMRTKRGAPLPFYYFTSVNLILSVIDNSMRLELDLSVEPCVGVAVRGNFFVGPDLRAKPL